MYSVQFHVKIEDLETPWITIRETGCPMLAESLYRDEPDMYTHRVINNMTDRPLVQAGFINNFK